MFTLEPGPIVPEALPLGPRVVRPGEFLALARELTVVLDSGVTRSDSATAALAPHAQTDVDPTFDGVIAQAVAGLDGLGLPGDAADVARASENLGVVEEDADSQRRGYPGPSEPEPDLGLGATVQTEPDPTDEERRGWQDQFDPTQQVP